MNTSLEHLPDSKQQELAHVLKILFSEFEDATVLGLSDYRRKGRILKVILFGSYARGDWVSDPVSGYTSDYDLLIVVNYDQLTDVTEYWANADDHLLREYGVSRTITAPVSFIVHTFNDVNEQVRLGKSFFVDILRDGVLLYDAPSPQFDEPKVLEPAEALEQACGYFGAWFETAGQFLSNGRDNADRGWTKLAAFNFHQAAERLYHCTLLVLKLYSPKSHKLTFLRSQAEQLDSRLIGVWPRAQKFEKRCFELLRRAYVDARYSPNYKISDEELAWLGERVGILQKCVEEVCKARLADLRARAGLKSPPHNLDEA